MSSPLGIPGLLQPDEIGRGGFGIVYRADEPEFDRAVAVKIIQDRVDDDEVQRAFTRECQAMGRLSGHPHIVTVHRGGTTDLGEPYIVMDLMDGGSLADRLRREGPLPWSEVLEIGVAVAGALETAHRAGILHLDVKPANVLMSRYGEPMLADFGISRLPGVTATTDGRVRASIAYAAPERLLDGTATPSSDLYALGSTLYTLLVGEPAFTTRPGEDLLVAISRIVRQPVPDLLVYGVPDPAVKVIERLLAKSPVDRFATAADAAFALQAAQRATGRPVTRAVVEGAPVTRGDPRSRPRRPPTHTPGEGLPAADPPLTRPRYVPRTRPDRDTATAVPVAADLVSAVPASRAQIRPAAAAAMPAWDGWPDPDRSPAPDVSTAPTLVNPPIPAADPTEPGASAPQRSGLRRTARRPLVMATAVALMLGLAVGAAQLLNRPSAAAPPASTSSSATPIPTPIPTPVPTRVPSSPAAPPRQIAVAGGVTHPDLDAVAARLDGYFRAINDRDYTAAFASFSPDSAVVDNGLAAFRWGNSTTAIQRQRILEIEDLGRGGVQATVTYRSTQDAEYGPNGETCTNWNLAYELTGPELLIRKARAVTRPQAC